MSRMTTSCAQSMSKVRNVRSAHVEGSPVLTSEMRPQDPIPLKAGSVPGHPRLAIRPAGHCSRSCSLR